MGPDWHRCRAICREMRFSIRGSGESQAPQLDAPERHERRRVRRGLILRRASLPHTSARHRRTPCARELGWILCDTICPSCILRSSYLQFSARAWPNGRASGEPRPVSCNWTDTVHTLFPETRMLVGPRGPNTSQGSPHHSSFHQRIGTIADSHRVKFMSYSLKHAMLMGSEPQL